MTKTCRCREGHPHIFKELKVRFFINHEWIKHRNRHSKSNQQMELLFWPHASWSTPDFFGVPLSAFFANFVTILRAKILTPSTTSISASFYCSHNNVLWGSYSGIYIHYDYNQNETNSLWPCVHLGATFDFFLQPCLVKWFNLDSCYWWDL